MMNPDGYRFPLQTVHKIPANDDGEFGSVISPGGVAKSYIAEATILLSMRQFGVLSPLRPTVLNFGPRPTMARATSSYTQCCQKLNGGNSKTAHERLSTTFSSPYRIK